MPHQSLRREWTERLAPWAHGAGLAATAWLVLPGGGNHLAARIFQSLTVGLLALGWALLMLLWLHLAGAYVSHVEAVPLRFHGGGAAVWYAPAILLPFSPAGITASAVLVIGATRLLCDGAARPREEEQLRENGAMLSGGGLALDAASPGLALALGVALGLEGALALWSLDHSASAAGLLWLSVATLSLFAIARGAWTQSRPPSLPRAVLGLCLTFLLAMMAGQMAGGRGWGFGAGSAMARGARQSAPNPPQDSVRIFVPKTPPPLRPPPGATGEVMPAPRSSEAGPLGSYPGVILWPEVQPQVALIEPVPATRAPGAPALTRPFVILFDGEYWMFRWPFARPPHNSYFRRESPAKFAFGTTDRAPLQMEALQKLDRSIDLSCCREIQVALRDADRTAAGITVELIVIDNQPPYKAPLSLGSVGLSRIPGGNTAPVAETVGFAIPPHPRIAQFDELQVVFHRDPLHQDRSSRIAVDRFILAP